MAVATVARSQEPDASRDHDLSIESTTNASTHAATPWYLNNVLSTSLDTPAAARTIPLNETVKVRGVIFDTDGSPAENAEVWAASVFHEPPLRERTVTDAEGTFILNLKPFKEKHDRWSLSAYKGTAGTNLDGNLDWIKQPNAEQPAPLSAQLVNRGMMHCRVLQQETGNTIPDARLFLGDGRVFVSDAEGRIEIGGLPQGNHRSVVLADGRLRRRVVFDNTLRSEGKLNIYLEQAGRITGTVVDQDNNPVPFAWIKASASGTAMALDGRCSLADANGRFVWEGVAYDRVMRSLDAGHEGYQSDEVNSLTVTEDKPTEVIFRLRKQRDASDGVANDEVIPTKQPERSTGPARRDITGTIVGPDGNPVPGAIVRWGATLYEDVHRELKSDERGEFGLKQVPDRDGYITVIAETLAPKFAKIDKGLTTIKITLEKGSSVGGQVVSSSNTPVSHVYIVPVIASPDPSLCNPLWISERGTQSDKDGRFEISGLPKAGVRLDFLHRKMDELRSQSLEMDRSDHTVRLKSRGAFRGRVVDTAGAPVEDFRVTIDFPRQPVPGDRAGSGFDVVMRGIGNSYTDEEGKFAFGDELSPMATYRVTVIADGYGNAINDRVTTTTIDKLQDADEYEFVMSPPHSLTVKVLDARSDQPLRDTVVTLVEGDPSRLDARFSWGSDEIGYPRRTTDATGIAEFKGLPASEATLAIQMPGFARQRLGWRHREPEFTVRLAPESSIVGTVQTTMGTPVRDVSVSLVSEDHQSNWIELNEQAGGEFNFDSLPSGAYTLSLRDERRELFKQKFSIRSEERLELDILLDPESDKATLQP